MSEFYVICVDSGILPESALKIGSMYTVVDGVLYLDKFYILDRYRKIDCVDDLNMAAKDFGARFIAAERICGIDE